MSRPFASCLFALAGVLVFSSTTHALVFDVTSTDDNPDLVIDGTCADAEGACTLRAAVQEANANVDPTPDEINVPAGKYVLKETGPDEDAAATGDLDLADTVVITGAGAELTVIQGKKDRVFEVLPGGTAVITDLTVTKGSIGTTKRVKAGEIFNGGGISNEGMLTLERVIVAKNKSADDGGGVSTEFGTLVMTDVLLTGNKAKDDAGGLEQDGGDSTLTRVTFVKNKAKDEAGGIEVEDATLTATNVTFSLNKARTGGGINAEQSGVVLLTNATFFKNKAKEASGAVANEDNGATVQLTNVILDSHKKGACEGNITSNGGNLETGSSCSFGAGDQSDVDKAGLEKLADNGGETPTHALAPDSPAVDMGTQTGCPTDDQRGTARDDGACDVGAFEL
jgi:predicted outer membrane repeat protein